MTNIYIIPGEPTRLSTPDPYIEMRNEFNGLLSRSTNVEQSGKWVHYRHVRSNKPNWAVSYTTSCSLAVEERQEQHYRFIVFKHSNGDVFVIYYGGLHHWGEIILHEQTPKDIRRHMAQLNDDENSYLRWDTPRLNASDQEKTTIIPLMMVRSGWNSGDLMDAFIRTFGKAREDVPPFDRKKHVDASGRNSETVYNKDWTDIKNCPRLDCTTYRTKGVEMGDVLDKEIWHNGRLERKDVRVLAYQVINAVNHMDDDNIIEALKGINVNLKDYNTFVIGVIAGLKSNLDKWRNANDYTYMQKITLGYAVLYVESRGFSCLIRSIRSTNRSRVSVTRKTNS